MTEHRDYYFSTLVICKKRDISKKTLQLIRKDYFLYNVFTENEGAHWTCMKTFCRNKVLVSEYTVQRRLTDHHQILQWTVHHFFRSLAGTN